MKKMNNIFSLNRFAKVLKHDFSKYLTYYLKSNFKIGLIIFLAILLVGVFIYPKELIGLAKYNVIFNITLILSFIAPYKVYGDINHSIKGMSFALLPASQIEKFSSMIFYTLVVIPISTVVSLGIIDIVFNFCASFFREQSLNYHIDFFSLILKVWQYSLMAAVISTSTNIIFRRNKIVRTLGCLLLVVLVFGIYTTIEGVNFLKDYIEMSDIYTDESFQQSADIAVNEAMRGYNILSNIVKSLPFVLLIISYFRMRRLNY